MIDYNKYVVHCKKSKYDVYIGRPGPWANPFSHLEYSKAKYIVETRDESIEKHREWFLAQPELIAKAKKELKNKTLGCYCRPFWNSCHGDILAEIANS